MEMENKDPPAEPVSLPLGFLRSITDDFCDERRIGEGAHGVVYKGILPCGSVIAIKKFNGKIPAVDERSFQTEVSFLLDIKHHNVVQLLGFCTESRGELMKQPNGKGIVVEQLTRMLCFEYMCNGGLDKHLSDESSGLEWNTRYKIIKGICSGLKYLHERNIIHRDLKPQNILMDITMVPKIADFGLSRLLGEQKSCTVTSNVAGTLGYMAPEYINKGEISKKADIFSLGVIIIQILKGCKDGYPDYHQNNETDFQHFTEKVLSNWRNRLERSSKYAAPELHTQLVKQCINIALECVHHEKEKRPNVSKIIEILNAAEASCCVQNGEDLLVNHQASYLISPLNGNPGRGAANGRAEIENCLTEWRTKATMKSAVAPHQPQRMPVWASADGSLAALRYQGARNASFWVAHKVLSSLEDNMLKNWAATIKLGSSVEALEQELLSVKAIIESTLGKVIHNLALEDILMVLQELVYDAEDVLDEMEYFRIQGDVLDEVDEMEYFHIQDMLDAGQHAEGDINVSPCSPQSSFHDDDNYNYDDDNGDYDDDDDNYNYDDDNGDYYDDDDNGDYYDDEPPKLRFDRDNASRRIEQIVEQMKLKRQEVSSAITLLGSDWSTAPNIAQSRPITISESIEPKLYGRELLMKSIIDDITKGKHSGEVLTVIPIVGPGGIGKTTLAQHIYHSGEVQEHFDVRVWTCVSFNFDVNKLTEKIQKDIPNVDGENKNGTASELIGQRLKNKRLLLVLDDVWDCSDEDEWKWLLLPFQKSQVQGNIIIVTTRIPAQAQIMVRKNDHSIRLQGIESKEFEDLFLEIIFGDDVQSRKGHKFLFDIGFKIASKLKGFPLAAKTIGRLLKTKLDFVHWKRVLESKEWKYRDGKNDIMPALKLSFDYLPSQLQQCFSYCALFPQDYKFEREELINFWIGLEVLHPSRGENKRVEDIGLSHLTELVSYGFLENKGENGGRTCYIIHDLLHELAQKVSSFQCLSYDSNQSQVSSLKVPPSIRHLSINIDDTMVKDRLTLKNCVEDFNTLDKILKVEKLHTLMIFGEHHGCFVKAFGELFREAKALRIVFLLGASYDVKDLLHNFYNLLHLRYLRIENSSPGQVRFPKKISRFYHMMMLDAKHCDISNLPRDISNLIKLRHFLVRDDATHSRIIGVGKLKSLQELRMFVVKREAQGFELREIGNLVDLHGSLCIANLENVQEEKEANEAKLLEKSHLHELILHWDNIDRSHNDYTLEEHVLERLKPSCNLQKLSVKGHKGATCPSWLGMNILVTNLESLCLDGVGWKTFPPIGELSLVNEPHGEIISGLIPDKRFENLRRLELCKLTMVKKWVVHAPRQLFPYLEALIISDCPQLAELSFEHLACCQQGKEANLNLFARLSELKIDNCPQLLSFPPVPWTEAPCSTLIAGTGSSCLDKLVCEKNYKSEYSLEIDKKNDTNDSMFWNVLAFQNLSALKNLTMWRWEPLPLHYLQMLSSLSTLQISCSSNAFPFVEADSNLKYQFPVESLTIGEWNASGKELTQLLTCFPKLSDLELKNCHKVTGMGVNLRGQRATETPGPSEEEEAEPGLLLLPPQLQELQIWFSQQRSLHRSNPHDNNKEDGPAMKKQKKNKEDGPTGGAGGGGLQGLTSLRRLHITNCPKLLFASCFPFPNSLQDLDLTGMVELDTETLLPLSNLTSLTSLSIWNCGKLLRGEGLLPLLTQANITQLDVVATPNFFVDSEPHEQELPPRSSKLQGLKIDDAAGLTGVPISRRLLFSSLSILEIYRDDVEHFTEEQEALLFVNSLEEISFHECRNLQYLPVRLHRLPNLKRLEISMCNEIQMRPEDCLPRSLQELVIIDCREIQSLPKVCIPSSLQKLEITRCQAIQMLPKDALPSSLQKLVIEECPAIQSLPNVDDLPSSLQELHVRYCGSEELERQCRKLINIIPIVKI